jgi:hypothetical protein
MAYAHILESEYYGDSIRWFIGTIVDVNDPLKLDRVRVRVYGIHTSDTVDIPTEDLPWASVLIPVTEGGTSGIGANSQVKNRAQVFGIFLDGKDSQCPLVMGSIPKIETKRNDVKEAASNKNIYDGTASVPEANPQGALPGTSALNAGNLIGKTNNEKAFNFFISPEGGSFEPHQAAGIVGNLIAESGVKGDISPTIVSGFKNEDSFGIAQWNPAYGRLQELRKFSAQANLNYRTLYAQLKFIVYELGKYSYLGLSKLRKAKTAEEASKVFEKKYERPAAGSTEKRINYALEINSKLGIGAA